MKFVFTIVLSLLSYLMWAQEKSDYYVSTTGNDTNKGNIEHPFATLEKALAVAQAQKEGVVIYLRKGIYSVPQNILLKERQNITISAFEKEEVIFDGGKNIDLEDVKSVIGTPFEKGFKPAVLEHISYIDLKSLGINNYGELKSVGFAKDYQVAPMELFINDEPYHLSRWPNDSTILIQDLLQPINSEGGDHSTRIQYETQHQLNWVQDEPIWIEGYFHHGYAIDALEVKDWNFNNSTISTQQAHIYGFATGQDWNRFYAYNILHELDGDKEYFIDREKGILFFYHPKDIQSLSLSILEQPIISIEHSENISIQNITFQNTRGMGIFMLGNNDCTIENCTFKNLGSLGIWLGKKTTKKDIVSSTLFSNHHISNNHLEGDTGQNNKISHCTIFNTGAGGIRLSGGSRLTLEATHNSVEHCEIHDYNRWEKSYRPAIRIEGVGNSISNCHIYNAVGQAILLEGNDHTIAYNDIHDVCLDVDDAGALYYGRNPSERGHVIKHNYFHHIGGANNYQTSAIYHDDGACGMKVYGNVFLKAGSVSVFIGGGSDNHYHNNLFLNCDIAMHIDDRLNNWFASLIAPDGAFRQLLDEINHDQPPYSQKYPRLAKYWTDRPSMPKRNYVDNNLFCSIVTLFKTGNDLLDWQKNNVLSNGYPSIWDEKMNDRTFQPNDSYLPRPQNWKPIEWEKIGIKPLY